MINFDHLRCTGAVGHGIRSDGKFVEVIVTLQNKNEALDFDDLPPERIVSVSSECVVVDVGANSVNVVDSRGVTRWLEVAFPPDAAWIGKKVRSVLTLDLVD